LRHDPVKIFLEGEREFGLLAVELEHARDWYNAGKRGIERLLFDALGARVGAQARTQSSNRSARAGADGTSTAANSRDSAPSVTSPPPRRANHPRPHRTAS